MYYDLRESGLRIKKLRQKAGLTQEMLAEQLNISWSMMAKIEIGNKGLSIDLLIELAVVLNSSLDYIILGRDLHVDRLKTKLKEISVQLSELENELT